MWTITLMFLCAFLVHNFVLLPQIVYRRWRSRYVLGTIVLMAAFAFVQYLFHTVVAMNASTMVVQLENLEDTVIRNQTDIVSQVLVVNMFILVLMFGMNFGVKLFFKSDEDQQKLCDLQEKNLEQQLANLKYQINPHFFMNTLNNIHALVDIDPEKAKWAIIVMSKMMRYILYEGNHTFIPLQKESDFIHSFVSLMRMRYTEKVSIKLDVPEHFSVGEIPPLLLICFVGNAFKHGVSYRHESTIDISLAVENDTIKFRCINSKVSESDAEKGGMGLESVHQRLNLIYPNHHTLVVEDREDTFSVWLELPLTNRKDN
ncbi:sensor histidine kinase [Prevotella falsenii]|uniref:sensor histidine kinase n=1 Tax=Prevotella falsenii TaxID=515414 RepID=UPI001E4DA4B1|nr:histidine kinase [Prevotella falsenii]